MTLASNYLIQTGSFLNSLCKQVKREFLNCKNVISLNLLMARKVLHLIIISSWGCLLVAMDSFVLAGFNSVGIASAGGAGKYASEWLDAGYPTMDLWSVDIRRFTSVQNDTEYLTGRVVEVLGLHYQMAWPNREMETSRNIRFTPLYNRFKK